MLRKVSLAAILALVLCGLVPPAAHADTDCSMGDKRERVCTVTATGPAAPGGGGGSQGPATINQGRVVCTKADGTETPCGGPDGTFWWAKDQCYVRDVTADFMPPEQHQDFWSSVLHKTDIKVQDYVALQCVEPAGPPFGMIVEGGVKGLWATAVDPAVVAQQAVQKMNLHAGQIGITPYPDPDHIGVIGLPTWMWIKDPGPSTTGPQSTTVTAGGTTVTVDASVTEIDWDMGDGVIEHCAGPGTPYEDSYGDQPSPTCGHRYQKQGTYTVTATTTWSIKWAGGGQSGTIPLTVTNTVTIVMGEIQVVVKPGNR